MSIRTLAATLAGAALFGLTAAPALAQTAAPVGDGVAAPPAVDAHAAPAKLPQGSDCHVDLHGTFADGQSMYASSIDVCAEKTLNLTD